MPAVIVLGRHYLNLKISVFYLISFLDLIDTFIHYKILLLFFFSVTRLPEKTTIYTTLVGLLNVRNYNFGGEVSKISFKLPILIFLHVVAFLLFIQIM